MLTDKILNSFFNDKAVFKYSKEKQLDYIQKKGEPVDPIQRSFFQYQAQVKHLNIFKRLFLNLISLVGLFIESITGKKKDADLIEKKESVFVFVHDLNNVPPQYRENDFYFEEKISGYVWSAQVKEFYKKIKKRFRGHPFFLLKVRKKLCFYQYLIKCYDPANIITSNEYSFTSSILTEFCNSQGVEHIDVMHGEKLFYFGDSFFYFNKLYVWDESYIRLFNSLRAKYDEISVYFPKDRFEIDLNDIKTVDLTYYLQMQTKKEMTAIRRALLCVGAKRIAIRPHPRYTDIELCKKVFKEFEVEDPSSISIEESLARTNIVVSIFSTVLLQAYCNSIKYYIDDISNRKQYERLKKLDYRLLSDNVLSRLL